MDEQTRPPVERQEVVERHEITERETVSPGAEPRPVGRSSTWLWAIPVVLVVAFLAWFALSRGEPQQIDMPEMEAPSIEMPAPEQNIEINMPEATSEPAAAPAQEPAQP